MSSFTLGICGTWRIVTCKSRDLGEVGQGKEDHLRNTVETSPSRQGQKVFQDKVSDCPDLHPLGPFPVSGKNETVSPHRTGFEYLSPCAWATASQVTFPSITLIPPISAGCFRQASPKPLSARSSM